MLIEKINKDNAVFIADFVAIFFSKGFFRYIMLAISDGKQDKIASK